MSKEIRDILKNIDARPKKGLGQNFLINKRKINRISDEVKNDVYDSIIEIGPGLGSITKKIIDSKSKIICIEKDTTLYNYLKEEFLDKTNIQILNRDILKCNLK